MILISNVSKVHKIEGRPAVHALNEVSLEIARGEFVSVMGPSGSGKSTLLNLISALDVPSSGKISIQGEDIEKLDDDKLTLFRRRRIGLVFQSFNLLPTLDAIGNVLLPLALERRTTAQDRDRAGQLLAEVGLASRTNHRIGQLSGGEMQRVAIARALIHEPWLLLADEPTGNLDSAIGTEILGLLRETCQQRRMTIVMVTHDRHAASYGQRLIQLKDGRVVGDEQLASSPGATKGEA